MATATQNTTEEKSIMSEAINAAAEASRRTVQSSQDAVKVSRELLDASTETGRKLFAAYTSVVSAGIKVLFDLQNAALSSNLSLVEAANVTSREWGAKVIESTHQAQQASLDMWQAGIRVGEKLAASSEKA